CTIKEKPQTLSTLLGMATHYLAVVVSLILLAATLFRLALKWGGKAGPCEARLPPAPGSRGLPILGETLEFFTAAPTLELLPFLKRRLDRYGPIFVTNLVCEDLVVSLDPEFSARVLLQEERAFQIWYPASFMRVFGGDNIITKLGPIHRHIRSLVLRLFGPETLRRALLRDVQRASRAELRSWLHHCRAGHGGVEVRAATSRMIFGVTAKKLISHDDAAASGGSLWRCFDACTRGLLSFPLCLPGTAFYRCMQGRRQVMRTLKRQLDERRDANAAAEREAVDFFDLVIGEMDKPNPVLDESAALDLLFLLLFASHETTSMGLTAILKFLTDNPEALQELTEEHEGILKRKAEPESDITWEEYKSYELHILCKCWRYSRSAQDSKHRSGRVQKSEAGCAHTRHGSPEPVGGSKDFMAFGGGLRLCVGADFAKLQMATFLHCLVTKYRWKAISGGRMVFYPGLRFPEGFHIQLLPKD
ncbi:hypothetical protein EJB05_05331, partial [Eragrostis curvula]